MSSRHSRRRVIDVSENIIGPRRPPSRRLHPRPWSDFAHWPTPYLELARQLCSPLFVGPPVCDESMALIRHVFDEDEALVASHLARLAGRSAAEVAVRAGVEVDVAAALLEGLARRKRCIASHGEGEAARYSLVPILPGMFEMVLIAHTPESLTGWHIRFVELLEALYDTGYHVPYIRMAGPSVRFLPVAGSLEGHPLALPGDGLEVLVERFDTFALGECQCRTSSLVMGTACDRPRSNCIGMGEFATAAIHGGSMRRISRQDVLSIKREAEASGLVNWILNVESTQGQFSCSCCGCCCKGMRAVNEFNAPAALAPPHFLPTLDARLCNGCGSCALRCPMGALTVDTRQKSCQHALERCIGCGLCRLACKRGALSMRPVERHQVPYRSWFAFVMESVPRFVRTSWEAWQAHH